MSDDTPPFYRDHLGQAQRRRLEALIAVRHMFPFAEPTVCVGVASWIVRGNPSSRIPTVVSEQAVEMEKLWKLYREVDA